ncbi:MAG: endo-1,3-alpha-glucanase family glycosylhydrolase [Anaerolineae bacterium]
MISRLCIVAALAALILTIAAAHPRPAAADGPLALAFYYAWYDDNTWTPDQVPDFPTPRYVSADRGTIERHVDQARGAGIDALVQSWWGANNPTDDNLKTLLDVAQSRGFHAAVDLELTSPFINGGQGAATEALRYLIQNYTSRPAYLKWNGKPVIFFWRQNMLSPGAWAAIRAAVDPNHNTLWIAEGTDTSYLSQFDGLHGYSVAWTGDPASTLVRWGNNVRKAGDKIFVATAMPGYDDTHIAGRGGRFSRDRAGGAYYRETFRGAQESGADWVVITSFNEWPEGTYIEPSEAYGDFYLKLTRDLIAQWKSGAPPANVAPLAAPAGNAAVSAGPLVAEAQNKLVIQFNPDAALQKRIFADGFVPNSAEFSIAVDGAQVTGQRAENLRDGRARVYYVRNGDWDTVAYVDASGNDAVASEAQKKQVMQFNPDAALQKRIFADGFVPNSGEFTVSIDGTQVTGQRAENLRDGRVRVYYVRNGDWGNVQFTQVS